MKKKNALILPKEKAIFTSVSGQLLWTFINFWDNEIIWSCYAGFLVEAMTKGVYMYYLKEDSNLLFSYKTFHFY